ncbi:Glyoxalase/bleomycin resistance protein/dioxygenase [Pseudopedobacter saltans DSM 12145]|uniref:Glyoxalase/bleomycin resistance protein/dioxygenase n=1 Tax=Pseudopedobacter saltans (strain ATCC 51119 / DSM 12145 / JCM 21818 / CCUG 39354 / LMG 10337 / NBRC 100064 / NCIMB 13643) TaxID=762903 RepID=F0SC78_PSESL|nr:VOC family protein [Pseudopedobacter saltans]ADY51675.1 Glyoxalase/bleomycin resistance protein/dioxygenase [Pseudopedobacter saltans DSM 12145]
MLKLKKTDHITVNYPEGEAETAINFYKNILGLKEIPSLVDKATWFLMGDIELHLTAGDIDNKLSSRHTAFEIESLDEAKKLLADNNIEIKYSSKITGRERLFFRDPFGNRFELVEYEV